MGKISLFSMTVIVCAHALLADAMAEPSGQQRLERYVNQSQERFRGRVEDNQHRMDEQHKSDSERLQPEGEAEPASHKQDNANKKGQ